VAAGSVDKDGVADSADPSEREFGPSGISLSKYRFPTGWFIVGFASELAPGQVKRAHYFGEELVMFRTESGQINVLDAYCQHLGANLGVGGTVEGERIVCPWHGWRWNGDGTNALIPYSKIGCKQNVRIRAYHSVQWYGFILVWHERHGRAPYWQPPVLPELETDEYYPLHPHTRMVNRVKVHAQMIIENAADPYHVQYVHKAANPATTASFTRSSAPSAVASSCSRIASAPSGTTLPVNSRTAWPGSTRPANGCPAGAAPITRSVAPSVPSAPRSA